MVAPGDVSRACVHRPIGHTQAWLGANVGGTLTSSEPAVNY
jgi:hypothetical protein